MLDIFGRKQQRVLGVDISSESVKIIELSTLKDNYTIEGYGYKPLPENAVEDATIKDISAVAQCIRTIISENKLSSKNAVVAVPDAHAISHIVQAHEDMDDDEIEEMVVMEADKYIPYPIEEVNLDFTLLGTSKKNTAMKDVLVVASRTENVMHRVNVINEAGLEPLVVDVESFAIERAAHHAYAETFSTSKKKLVVVIDIGAVYTRFYGLSNSKIIFSREELFGGNQLIQSIMQTYSMSFEEAKTAYFSDKLPDGFIEKIIEPFQSLILLQVKRGLQFFFSSTQFSQVDHVLLAGGVAKLRGISELIESHINVPIEIANPIKNMNLGGRTNQEIIKHDSPSLMVSCGLALRASTTMWAG